MTYQELSPQGEALLKEIIDLQTSGKDNAAPVSYTHLTLPTIRLV